MSHDQTGKKPQTISFAGYGKFHARLKYLIKTDQSYKLILFFIFIYSRTINKA
jgi:hypothetical protein